MAPFRLRAAFGSAVSSTCIVFLLAAAPARGADQQGSEAPADPQPAEVRVSPAPADGHAAAEGSVESIEALSLEAFVLSQQTQALRAAIATTEARFREQLAALQTAFDQASDESVAMDLQRQMETLKFEHEVDLVLVQAEHARAMGREELAEQAQRIVMQLRDDFLAGHRDGDATDAAPADDPDQE